MSNQITPNPSVPTQVVQEMKFPKMINNLGIIPTSYKDSMSYYECLAWLCKFLEESVIPTLNENGEAVEELQGLYIELNNYVTHYFDTLDVQQEINNKLDEMALNGTLQSIILDYLTIERIFDTTEDLIESETLIVGNHVKTLGYHTINDGGQNEYIISDSIDSNYIQEELQNNLYANLIIKNGQLSPNQVGAYGNGTNDDITYLNKCRDYCIANHILMVGNSNCIYGISQGFSILTGCSYDFKNATIKSLSSMNYTVLQHRERNANDPVDNDYTQNIIIDCNHLANYGFYQDTLGWSTLTENIRVLNPLQIGIYIKVGQIRLHNCKVEQDSTIANCIGVQVDSTDSEYYNIITRDCAIGFKITADTNSFYECHPVLFNTSLLPNSKAFLLSATNLFVHPIIDTFQYGFYVTHAGGFATIYPQLVTNTTYYNDDTMETAPYLFYFTNQDYASRVTSIGASMGTSAISSLGFPYLTNLSTWNSGSPLLLMNPSINFLKNSYQGIPNDIAPINSSKNIASLINANFTCSNASAITCGKEVEIRLTNVTLPDILANSTISMFSSIPDNDFISSGVTKATNTITKNGVPVSIILQGNAIKINPFSAITQGDILNFTHVFVK